MTLIVGLLFISCLACMLYVIARSRFGRLIREPAVLVLKRLEIWEGRGRHYMFHLAFETPNGSQIEFRVPYGVSGVVFPLPKLPPPVTHAAMMVDATVR